MRERSLRPVDVARWLAAVVFLAVILWRVDVRAVGARLAHLDARFVVAFIALSVPLYLLYAWRWRFTAARLGVTLPFRHAYFDYYLSTLLNQVLPVGIAGDFRGLIERSTGEYTAYTRRPGGATGARAAPSRPGRGPRR